MAALSVSEAPRASDLTDARAPAPETDPAPPARPDELEADPVPAAGEGVAPDRDAGAAGELDAGTETADPDDEDDEEIELGVDDTADSDQAQRGPSGEAAAAILDAAAGRYRVKMVGEMWVSQRQKGTTTWMGAIQACRDFELDGVAGWRIPFRRELKLLGAVGALPDGTYWSRSLSETDDDYVFVYETSDRRLVEWLKQEPTGAVVCVRSR